MARLLAWPGAQFVSINFLDEAGPRLFQLPPYGGMWYIMLAFGPAGIWLFGTGLILLITILVWVSGLACRMACQCMHD